MPSSPFLFQDPTAPIPQRITDLLERMTLAEKVGQMLQVPANGEIVPDPYEALESMHVGSFLHVTADQAHSLQEKSAATRLGIPLIYGIDAIHGHCFEPGTTVYPSQLSMSSSWNSELIGTMARQAGCEVAAGGLHWTFSPVLCLGRDPRWGRVDETFGEDGFLAGALGEAMVRGYQGVSLSHEDSILACPKHFVAYGETTGGRDSYEAEVSRRKLRSLFLSAFERAVRSGAMSIMAGYQAIDGLPCSANPWLLNTVLRDEWGFEGLVVTDWNNVGNLVDCQHVAADLKEAAFLAIRGGNDIIMSTPSFFENAITLVEEGRIEESEIDRAVERILRVKFRLGLFDHRRYTDPARKSRIFQQPAHLATALQCAREAMVLLENHDTLPLAGGVRIALTGPSADNHCHQLGDWSFGSGALRDSDKTIHKADTVTIRQGLEAMAGAGDIELDHTNGCDIFGDLDDIDAAVESARSADVVVACVGDDPLQQAGEFRDRAQLTLSGHQQRLLEALKATGKPLIVVIVSSKPLVVPWIKENADAVICTFNPGMFGGQAVAEVLLGNINPLGKLTISWPYCEGQLPVYYGQYPGWHAWESSHWSTSRYRDVPVAGAIWAFGEGKSYSHVRYGAPKLSSPRAKIGDTISVRIPLENTEGPDATEIVQVYVHDKVSSVTLPALRLGGFARVHVAAGQSATAEITIAAEAFTLIDQNENRITEPGEFEVLVGPSSRYASLQICPLTLEAQS